MDKLTTIYTKWMKLLALNHFRSAYLQHCTTLTWHITSYNCHVNPGDKRSGWRSERLNHWVMFEMKSFRVGGWGFTAVVRNCFLLPSELDGVFMCFRVFMFNLFDWKSYFTLRRSIIVHVQVPTIPPPPLKETQRFKQNIFGMNMPVASSTSRRETKKKLVWRENKWH